MKSPMLLTLGSILLTACSPLYTQSQTKPVKKELVGSISGKVTVNGKAASGIVVGLSNENSYNRQTPVNKGTTDQEGNYRITNVPPGNYRVMPTALAFVITKDVGGKYVLIAAGESVEGIDFSLVRGGVITGKVTDTVGRPLIEEQVTLWPEENNFDPRAHMFVQMNVQTDDRGVYRLFGIPAGKYRVAVGESGDSSLAGGPRRSPFKQTFHPSGTDPSKAVLVEVSEGGEATNIDITVGPTLTTFAASGRIVDGETGHPLPNIKYGLLQILESSEHSMLSQTFLSDSRGEFRLENLTPGKYAVFLVATPGAEVVAEPAPFELVDQDVTGVIVKTSRGASVSGVVVLDSTDKTVLAQFGRARFSGWLDTEGYGDYPRPMNLGQDGSFKIGGLPHGMMHFSISTADGSYLRGFMIKRVERDGIAQPRGLEIKDLEQVTGVRVVIGYGNGTVRGLVKVAGGVMPANARFSVWLTSSEDAETLDRINSMPSPVVDSRGRFVAEGLPPGNYEVNAAVFVLDSGRDWPRGKQQVSVADGEVTEVTITVDLNSNPRPTNP